MAPVNSISRSSSISLQLGDYQEPDPPNPEAIAAERRRARKRTIILAVSSTILLVIVVIIGASSAVLMGPASDGRPTQDAIAAAKIEAFCSLTDFPDVCIFSLTNYTGLNAETSDDPKSLLLSSIAVTIQTIKATYKIAKTLVKDTLDTRTRSAVSDCEHLLVFAVAELNASYADLDTAILGSMPRTLNNLLSRLSAAVSFEETCNDGLGRGVQMSEMREMLKNATEETRNNLAMIYMFSAKSRKRRLLAMVEGDRLVWHAARGEANVVVAKDGSGDFTTIGEALKEAKKEREGRFVIYVKEGIYEENVRVTASMKYITMYGDGANKTMVTGSKSFKDGISVYKTATFAVSGVAFMARNMGFKNTAGPGKAQAVALRVESDLSVFYNCHIHGHHTTLLAHAHRQFYCSCVIFGTVDIIYGGAAAAFQNCKIVVKKPPPGQHNIITAHTRIDRHQTTGISLQNCTISAAADLFPVRDQVATYLGRPVKEHSRTVVMQSTIGDLVRPEGWAGSRDGAGLDRSVYFAEFGNHGPGSGLGGRVTWEGFHVLDDVAEVTKYTAGEFVEGIYWLNMTGVQFYTGVIDAF